MEIIERKIQQRRAKDVTSASSSMFGNVVKNLSGVFESVAGGVGSAVNRSKSLGANVYASPKKTVKQEDQAGSEQQVSPPEGSRSRDRSRSVKTEISTITRAKSESVKRGRSASQSASARGSGMAQTRYIR